MTRPAKRESLLIFVVGARPNFVKAAPVIRQAAAAGVFRSKLIHTGQHYDASLSESFFGDLEIPEPDLHLEVGSGSHARQTADVMQRLEKILLAEHPDCTVVFGDVNSTLAASLTAAKLCLPLAHVESGLRSFDRTMPEEVNRRVTDCLSDWLFTTEASGNENLLREGVLADRIHFVGNTMVDSLVRHLEAARQKRSAVLSGLGLNDGHYGILTLHRPANVDDFRMLERIWRAVVKISQSLPLVFPVHPRTRRRLEDSSELFAAGPPHNAIRLTEPLPYLAFLGLLDGARLVLTDSGGIQEETTALGIPCLTLRDNTERPVTIDHGTNELVGRDPDAILSAAQRSLATPRRDSTPTLPPLWDGEAAARIVEVLGEHLGR